MKALNEASSSTVARRWYDSSRRPQRVLNPPPPDEGICGGLINIFSGLLKSDVVHEEMDLSFMHKQEEKEEEEENGVLKFFGCTQLQYTAGCNNACRLTS